MVTLMYHNAANYVVIIYVDQSYPETACFFWLAVVPIVILKVRDSRTSSRFS